MLRGHSDIVYGAAFSPDGKLLATASGDGTTRLWNVGTGACTRVLTGHTGIVSAVAFSPDGALDRHGQLRRHRAAVGGRRRATACAY